MSRPTMSTTSNSTPTLFFYISSHFQICCCRGLPQNQAKYTLEKKMTVAMAVAIVVLMAVGIAVVMAVVM